jgi:hypothetical protein
VSGLFLRRVFWLMHPNRTFQVGFILAIVAGLGVGETLFGRYQSNAAQPF